MTGARLKLLSLMLVGVLGAVVLLAWSQPWFTVTLVPEGESQGDSQGTLVVGGDVAASALPPLALASLALVLALAIAGPGFRILLGVLEALLGAVVALVSGIAIGDPIAASSPVITNATGVAGVESLAQLVEQVTMTAWPVVALIAGLLTVLLGLLIAVTYGRWPKSGRKYSRSRFEAADASSPVDEWDALSEGDDPTKPDKSSPLD